MFHDYNYFLVQQQKITIKNSYLNKNLCHDLVETKAWLYIRRRVSQLNATASRKMHST